MLLTVIDIETTGLNPGQDTLLEYAAVRWNYASDQIEGVDHLVLAHPYELRGDRTALQMHERTGLLDQVQGKAKPPATARRLARCDLETAVLDSIDRGRVDGRPAELAGANLASFDVPFIRHLVGSTFFAAWNELAHYRVLDVGSLAAAAHFGSDRLNPHGLGGLVPGAARAAQLAGAGHEVDWQDVVRHTALGDAFIECETIRRLLGLPGRSASSYFDAALEVA